MGDNADLLLDILASHASDESAKQRCYDMLRQMRNENETPEFQELTLASALVDGLRYGNWPWKINTPVDAVQVDTLEPDWGANTRHRPGA